MRELPSKIRPSGRAGSTRVEARGRQRGFTLIELLIVVVIVGILAALAIPKFRDTKGKSYAATLKADLRNMVTAQEAYMYDHSAYTSNLGSLNLALSSGVVVTWGTATAAGWSAKVTHPLSFPLECAVFIGNVPPLAPAQAEGLIRCQ
jgi:prepilin-type N-terminal cleavage/methylation domain-containing protein